MAFNQFPTISPGDAWDMFAAQIMRSLRLGKTNNVGEITLTAGTTTNIADQLIGPDSMIVLSPKSGGAKNIKWSIDSYDKGSAIITHDAATGTEVYRYAVIGG